MMRWVIDHLLKNESNTQLQSFNRSSRTEPPDLIGIMRSTDDIIESLVCPPPPSDPPVISEEMISGLIVPAPGWRKSIFLSLLVQFVLSKSLCGYQTCLHWKSVTIKNQWSHDVTVLLQMKDVRVFQVKMFIHQKSRAPRHHQQLIRTWTVRSNLPARTASRLKICSNLRNRSRASAGRHRKLANPAPLVQLLHRYRTLCSPRHVSCPTRRSCARSYSSWLKRRKPMWR